MSKICIHNNCALDAKYHDKCSLHCNKGDYATDRMSEKLSDFYEDLRRLILNEAFSESKVPAHERVEVLKQMIIHLKDIQFPDRDPRDAFDYFELFKMLKGLHFDNSTISFDSLNLPDIQLFSKTVYLKTHGTFIHFQSLKILVIKHFFKTVPFKEKLQAH